MDKQHFLQHLENFSNQHKKHHPDQTASDKTHILDTKTLSH